MSEDEVCCKPRRERGAGPGSALYGLGIIGAAVYYVQASTGFWAGVLGVIKAFFWPAFVVYKVFQVWGL